MDNQQGPPVEQWELCSTLCGSLDGRAVWERMDTCVCMAESLCCPPETIRILLIGYTPVGYQGGTRGQYRRLKRRSFYCEDPGGGPGTPLQYSYLENPLDRGTWWTIVHSVTKSQTRLKQLSMHSEYKIRS